MSSLMFKRLSAFLVIIFIASKAYSGEPSRELIASLSSDSAKSALAIWEKAGHPCNYELNGIEYSYLSTVVDIGFDATPFNDIITVDNSRVQELVEYMVLNNCNLNVPHPVTGHLPIHSAVIFYRKNIKLTKYLISSGADLESKTPMNDEYFPNMNAIDILREIIEKYPPQSERKELLDLLIKR